MVPNAICIGHYADSDVEHWIDADKGRDHSEKALELPIEEEAVRCGRVVKRVRRMMNCVNSPKQTDPVVKPMVQLVGEFMRYERYRNGDQ